MYIKGVEESTSRVDNWDSKEKCTSISGLPLISKKKKEYANNIDQETILNKTKFKIVESAIVQSCYSWKQYRSKLKGIFVVLLIALDEKTHTTTFDTFAAHSFSPHRKVLTRRQ